MPAYDLCVDQGSNYSLLFQAKDNNGNPINLSGYSLTGVIRQKYSCTGNLLSFNSVIGTPQSGICQVSLDYTQTSGLAVNTYVYNIQAYNGDNSSVFSLLAGYLSVNPLV